MTKRMLIDATHAEETRVVVLDGNRLEDFDVETSTKKQLKGNIYLAKIVRVEPSLQAAFVEYGGGRHGFLAFGEIHPDYYQIPVADRQRLLAMQAEEARAEEEAEDEEDRPQYVAAAPASVAADSVETATATAEPVPTEAAQPAAIAHEVTYGEVTAHQVTAHEVTFGELDFDRQDGRETEAATTDVAAPDEAASDDGSDLDAPVAESPAPETLGGESDVFEGNGAEEARQRRASRFLRNYRIQEVINRRQIMLIQVVKEERGTKGAALTTYISLAGRFCVLMPNSPRGGGISRKITSAADRRRLKEITAELEIPNGMGLIVRTAGAARPKPEIRRDCEYLMRLWDDVREHTLQSMAPSLIYEEASLIKRAIRDGYSRDIDEVLVDGEEGWKAAHDFMRMLMPTHARKVVPWRAGGNAGNGQPLFASMGVEAQLDSMLSPSVQLKSGGYLVINQAEALVAIDVNSGRATRERGIEETAVKTNLEAADEVARQLRLRDLAGLIVIDFIDMESKKNNAMVERRLKEALKNDRARIQVGQISHFGLMEMSRQRLRPSLTETNFITCPHCNGLGHVRSVESSAIHVLRGIEEEGAKGRASLVMVYAASAIVMYILNNKRERLAEIEARYAMQVHFSGDDTLVPPAIRIDRLRAQIPESEREIVRPTRVLSGPVAPAAPDMAAPDTDEDDFIEADEEERAPAPAPRAARAAPSAASPAAEAGTAEEEAERGRRRRRRRRGERREAGDAEPAAADGAAIAAGSDADAAALAPADGAEAPPADDAAIDPVTAGIEAELASNTGEPSAAIAAPTPDTVELDENGQPKARRRGRRGGRRRRRDEPGGETEGEAAAEPDTAGASPIDVAPVVPPVFVTPAFVAPAFVAPAYAGPTPANPFADQPFDIFDMIDQAAEKEAAAAAAAIALAAASAAAVRVVVETIVPEPVATEPVAAEPAVVVPAVEPALPVAAVPEVVAPVVVVPEPEPEAPAAAAIRPIVIGQDPVPDAPAKKGWWRR